MRGRSYSYSPPARSYGERRGRSPSPSPRGRYGSRSRDLPTSLLVRNLRRDCRPEDLRKPFGKFGPVKDIYLPRDYYTGEPRGFGFVQYVDPDDADEAKHQMDGHFLFGRELTVVFAEENRKKPSEMRARDKIRGPSYDYRRSPRYSHSRSRSPRYSRSLRYSISRSRSYDYRSPSPRRHRYSRSISPRDTRHSREKSYYSRERTYYSGSPVGSRSRSPAEYPTKPSHREKSYSPDGSRSRSRIPFYPIKRSNRERSFSPRK